MNDGLISGESDGIYDGTLLGTTVGSIEGRNDIDGFEDGGINTVGALECEGWLVGE
jgi:hypothetical protein